MGLKWTEILLIGFALVLLFGTTRLPQLGQSLGSAIRNLKKGLNEIDEGPVEHEAVPVVKDSSPKA